MTFAKGGIVVVQCSISTVRNKRDFLHVKCMHWKIIICPNPYLPKYLVRNQ